MQLAKEKISKLLQQVIGLDITSIGDATLQRALKNRMKEKGFVDIEQYFDKLKVSQLELRKLVEEVVVPETWFFRDQEPFNFLTDYIMHSEKDLSLDSFRILSIPCSTGEEPYSIAMSMFQAGLQPTSFYIDAVDVSERVLALARQGFYKKNSFRTQDLSFRDSFFYKQGNGYILNTPVRNKVRFLHGNILNPQFIESIGLYDVVFCRNVLIYFTEESQKQAIGALYNLLMPEGLLFTGHSEASLFYDARFVPAAHSKSFAFYKQKNSDPVSAKLSGSARGVTQKNDMEKGVFWEKSDEGPAASIPKPTSDEESGHFSIVREMADRGQLKEAASLCEQHLREGGPSAQWFYLLGVILDSMGETREAVKLLRKALYLDPESIESLVQLSLLAERAGDHTMAENYKRRARRLQGGG